MFTVFLKALSAWEPWGDGGPITGLTVWQPGPSEEITVQQGDHCDPQKSPPEAREHTAVK